MRVCLPAVQGCHRRAPHGTRTLPKALRIFPRYNVVEAMLVEVERLDPDRLPEVQRLAAELDRAAWVAQSLFTDPPGGQVQAEVMEHVRQLFSSAVQTWMSLPDLDVEPLGYWRGADPGGIVGLARAARTPMGHPGVRPGIRCLPVGYRRMCLCSPPQPWIAGWGSGRRGDRVSRLWCRDPPVMIGARVRCLRRGRRLDVHRRLRRRRGSRRGEPAAPQPRR
jgi:hypothetical protein